MNTWGSGGIEPFLNSALGREKWSASCRSLFNHRERGPGTHYIWGWVVFKPIRLLWRTGKNSLHQLNIEPRFIDRPIRRPSTYIFHTSDLENRPVVTVLSIKSREDRVLSTRTRHQMYAYIRGRTTNYLISPSKEDGEACYTADRRLD